MAVVCRGLAGAVCRLCAAADSVHAQHQRHPQGQARAAGADPERRRQADRRVQAQQPPVGAAGADFARRGQGPRGHRRPPLLRAPWHGLHAHRGVGHPHAGRQSPGRLHHHPAVGAQSLSHGNRPRPQCEPQAQGGDHGLQDRSALHQGRDSRDLSEHRALSLQRLWHRDGGAHLFRQTGGQAHGAGKCHAGGHAQGQCLLQPGDQPRPRDCAAQHRAEPDGQARRTQGR